MKYNNLSYLMAINILISFFSLSSMENPLLESRIITNQDSSNNDWLTQSTIFNTTPNEPQLNSSANNFFQDLPSQQEASTNNDWMTQAGIWDFPRSIKSKQEKKQKKPTVIKPRSAIGKKKSSENIDQQLEHLKEHINNLNKSELEKYASIIKPIQNNLQNPKSLKINQIKLMNYSIRLIQEEDIQKIINDIKQENLKLEQKLNILDTLYSFENPVFYKEPLQQYTQRASLVTAQKKANPTLKPLQYHSQRSPKIIKQDQEELKSWLNKKNAIKDEINKISPLIQTKQETEKLKNIATVNEQFNSLQKEIWKNEEKQTQLEQDSNALVDSLISKNAPKKQIDEYLKTIDWLTDTAKQRLEYYLKNRELETVNLIKKITSEENLHTIDDDKRYEYVTDILNLAAKLGPDDTIDKDLIANLKNSQVITGSSYLLEAIRASSINNKKITEINLMKALKIIRDYGVSEKQEIKETNKEEEKIEDPFPLKNLKQYSEEQQNKQNLVSEEPKALIQELPSSSQVIKKEEKPVTPIDKLINVTNDNALQPEPQPQPEQQQPVEPQPNIFTRTINYIINGITSIFTGITSWFSSWFS